MHVGFNRCKLDSSCTTAFTPQLTLNCAKLSLRKNSDVNGDRQVHGHGKPYVKQCKQPRCKSN